MVKYRCFRLLRRIRAGITLLRIDPKGLPRRSSVSTLSYSKYGTIYVGRALRLLLLRSSVTGSDTPAAVAGRRCPAKSRCRLVGSLSSRKVRPMLLRLITSACVVDTGWSVFTTAAPAVLLMGMCVAEGRSCLPLTRKARFNTADCSSNVLPLGLITTWKPILLTSCPMCDIRQDATTRLTAWSKK
jgi:hypothetical protein